MRIGRAAGPGRGGRRDQPLVVEERAAERGLEEAVRDRVTRVTRPVQVAVNREVAGVIDALREAQRVTAGRVAVLLAPVELVLLLVEAMDQIARATTRQTRGVLRAVRAGPCRGRDELLDQER